MKITFLKKFRVRLIFKKVHWGDNEIVLNIIFISYDGELESFKFIRDSKNKKSELV